DRAQRVLGATRGLRPVPPVRCGEGRAHGLGRPHVQGLRPARRLRHPARRLRRRAVHPAGDRALALLNTATMDPALMDLITRLALRLRERGWMMATAESCTGGLIASACTELSGSSDWFDRGFITYSNRAKAEML